MLSYRTSVSNLVMYIIYCVTFTVPPRAFIIIIISLLNALHVLGSPGQCELCAVCMNICSFIICCKTSDRSWVSNRRWVSNTCHEI